MIDKKALKKILEQAKTLKVEFSADVEKKVAQYLSNDDVDDQLLVELASAIGKFHQEELGSAGSEPPAPAEEAESNEEEHTMPPVDDKNAKTTPPATTAAPQENQFIAALLAKFGKDENCKAMIVALQQSGANLTAEQSEMFDKMLTEKQAQAAALADIQKDKEELRGEFKKLSESVGALQKQNAALELQKQQAEIDGILASIEPHMFPTVMLTLRKRAHEPAMLTRLEFPQSDGTSEFKTPLELQIEALMGIPEDVRMGHFTSPQGTQGVGPSAPTPGSLEGLKRRVEAFTTAQKNKGVSGKQLEEVVSQYQQSIGLKN